MAQKVIEGKSQGTSRCLISNYFTCYLFQAGIYLQRGLFVLKIKNSGIEILHQINIRKS